MIDQGGIITTTNIGKMTLKNNISEKIVEIEHQNAIKGTTTKKNLIKLLVLSAMRGDIIQISVRIKKTIKYRVRKKQFGIPNSGTK